MAGRTTPDTRQPSDAGVRPAPNRAMPWLIAALVAAAFHGVLQLGPFADDFIFLDAARRHPLSEVFLGWHGIWPWYRPLSRELFFAAAAAAGPLGAPLAHALGLVTLWAVADTLWRVLSRRLGATAATIAVALFLGHSLTFFLTGWLSGFQDLLALALALAAVRLQQEGRGWPAMLCAGLAPFAKETGFIVFPLLALDVVLGERRRPKPREWAGWAAVVGAAAGVHLLVRATWPNRPAASTPDVEGLQQAGPVLVQALTPWTEPPGPADGIVWLAAAVAALLVFVMLRGTTRARAATPRPASGFVMAAMLLSLAPALAPVFLPNYALRAHFLFAALPWACGLVGGVLARFVPLGALAIVLPLVCGALVWSAAPRPVDLDVPAGWELGPLGWAEAQRIEARTRRLEHEVRRLLAVRPESLTVGYLQVPSGAWYQTEDGPATREALHDPTVRAFFVRDLPRRVSDDPGAPVVLLDYDPDVRHTFVGRAPTDPAVSRQAVFALLDRRHAAARAIALFVARADSTDGFPPYFAAIATLLETGRPDAFAAAVLAMGSAGRGPAREAGDEPTAAALRIALASPLSPEAHRVAADSMATAQAPALEALELFVAVTLDSTRAGDALRLGRLLAPWMPESAGRAYALAARPGSPAAIADAARREAAMLGTTP